MLAMVIMILFIVFLLIPVPISATLPVVPLTPPLLDPNFHISAEYIIHVMLGGIDSSPLLAVLMFALSDILMVEGGVSKKLFDVLSYFLGEHTIGMSCAVIVTCLFYGVISDDTPATAAVVGSMTIPLSIRMGYDKVFVTAIIAVIGGLGVIIPPNIPFVLSGIASGTSVDGMSMVGIISGVLTALLLMPYVLYYCERHGKGKKKIHAEVSVLYEKELVKMSLDSSWTLLIPVIILGCIYNGAVSLTEVVIIFVFHTLIISMCIYRILKFYDSRDVLVEATRTFASVLFIPSAAVAFSRTITLLQIPGTAEDFILSTFSGKAAILLVINALLLIVDMIVDISSVTLILTSILILITNSLGTGPIQSGIIMVVNLTIGLVIPPIGINLFVTNSLTGAPVIQVAKKATSPIVLLLIALLAITSIPRVSPPLVS